MPTETKTRRPRKKAEAVVEAVALETSVAPTQAAPLPTRVSLNDLWALRLAKSEKRIAEVEKRLAQAQAESARMARLYALSKLDPKGIVLGIEKQRSTAEAAERAADKAAEKAENEALIAIKRMEAMLGRPLQGLAIDPDSGEVSQPA